MSSEFMYGDPDNTARDATLVVTAFRAPSTYLQNFAIAGAFGRRQLADRGESANAVFNQPTCPNPTIQVHYIW